VLQNFDADDLRRRFDDHLDKLTADFTFGKVSVLQEIAKAKKKPAEARAVIQIGIVIGGADGDVDKTEQAVVREACFPLDLPPHEFDLWFPTGPGRATSTAGTREVAQAPRVARLRHFTYSASGSPVRDHGIRLARTPRVLKSGAARSGRPA
jgi:hypothetical protein